MCISSEETVLHLFVSCSYARQEPQVEVEKDFPATLIHRRHRRQSQQQPAAIAVSVALPRSCAVVFTPYRRPTDAVPGVRHPSPAACSTRRHFPPTNFQSWLKFQLKNLSQAACALLSHRNRSQQFLHRKASRRSKRLSSCEARASAGGLAKVFVQF
ncbi:unnamed protein product [Cuscuta campestris]|uniref:Uncharacterized protein n=1 Tax=Cuscuta campestris TaxID=132261 RepID=A0A484MYQ2_9ASTE|nr:unnamed protein product [Cuscuta campestris]